MHFPSLEPCLQLLSCSLKGFFTRLVQGLLVFDFLLRLPTKKRKLLWQKGDRKLSNTKGTATCPQTVSTPNQKSQSRLLEKLHHRQRERTRRPPRLLWSPCRSAHGRRGTAAPAAGGHGGRRRASHRGARFTRPLGRTPRALQALSSPSARSQLGDAPRTAGGPSRWLPEKLWPRNYWTQPWQHLGPEQLGFWPTRAHLARATGSHFVKAPMATKPQLGLPGTEADAVSTCVQPGDWQRASDGPGIFLQLQSKVCWECASSRQQKALSAPKIQNQSVPI